jgi:hypothetical protein
MNTALRHTCRLCLSLLCLAVAPVFARADQWTAPTPEELSMTAAPEAPGASAIYLNREEITDDQLHMWRKYARIKVLTEGGKDLANVEVGQYNSNEYGGYKIEAVAGRTIHPDGTIIPFTGKPYEKLIEKGQGYKATAKVFTLPSVEVGSIIEYRYELRYDDNVVFPPSWIIQSDLFTRHGHYVWLPTGKDIVVHDERGEVITNGAISWTPILPKGAELKHTELPGGGPQGPQRKFELNIDNVPGQAEEEYMPPIRSLGYRVLFFYAAYNSPDQFWKESSKRWSKVRDHFIGPGSKVQAAVKELVQPADTEEQKLRKIYAAVLKLDNTVYSREHSRSEEHAQGLGEVKNTDDVLERKRGTDDQLAELFVAMARAAGFKAYVMAVTNRDQNIFLPSYMSMDQLNDFIAVVNVGGKEQFFDPGQPFCPYGQLAWKHSMTQGIRQTDNGATFATTPAAPYKESHTDRIADLTIDEHGEASGSVTLGFSGSPALRWRQQYLRGDAESFRHELQAMLEGMMPSGMDIKVQSIKNLEEYEQPLSVTYDVKGAIASSTGKRVLLPSDIFVFGAKPTFSHNKRDQAVYFPYTYMMLDAVRLKYPAGYTVESVPATEEIPYMIKDSAGKPVPAAIYQIRSQPAGNSITVRRSLLMGDLIFPTAEYPDLYAFFTKFEARDHEPTVLKIAPQAAAN